MKKENISGKRRRMAVSVLFTALFMSILIAQTVVAKTVFFGRYVQQQIPHNSIEEKYLDKNGEFIDRETVINGVRYGVKKDYYYKDAPIEWYVIKEDGNNLVLLSKYILAYSNFYDLNNIHNVFWDKSVLRRFLNNDFYQKAFSSSEQAKIIPTTVSTEEYTYESIYITGEKKSTKITTSDKVFALSKDEIRYGDYVFEAGVLKGIPSPYLDPAGTPSKWYLRGPCGWNYGNETILFVNAAEDIDWWYGTYSYGVRPCIRVPKYDVSYDRPKDTSAGIAAMVQNFQVDIIPEAPELHVELSAYNAVKISWDKRFGAEKYILYMKQGSGNWKKLTTTTAVKYTKKKLSAGKKYSFKVISLSKNGKKGKGSKAVSITTLSKITGVKVSKSSGKVKVTWKKQSNCDGYELSIAKSGSGKNDVKAYAEKAKKNSITITVAGGKKLYYKVRAFKRSSSKRVFGPWSAAITYTLPKNSAKDLSTDISGDVNTAFVGQPGKVTDVKAVPFGDDNDILVTWKGLTTASEYLIYAQKGKNGSSVLIKTVKAEYLNERVSVSGKKLKEDTQYYIYIVARNNWKQAGGASEKVAVTTQKKVTGISIKDCGNSIVKISWKKVNGKIKPDGYRVSVRYSEKGDRIGLIYTKKTSMSFPALSEGTLYYSVSAYAGNSYGPEDVKPFSIRKQDTGTAPDFSKTTELRFSYEALRKKDDKTRYNTSVNWKYSDSFFLKDATKPVEEVSELAVLSCLGAAASYNPSKKLDQEFLTTCGFTTGNEYVFSYNSNLLDNHHSRMRMGYKVVSDGEGGNMLIIAGLINGYNSDGYEWISNFELGDGNEEWHKGFFEASNELLSSFIMERTDKIKQLSQVKGKNITKTKYWLMGHSRGGAITAIVSHKLHEEQKIPQKDIYGFGYATPRMIRGQKKEELEKETNIKNFLVDEDFVTHVAPKDWGYERYGVDILLKKNISNRNLFFSLSAGEEYEGFKKDETDELINAFVKLGQDPQKYASNTIFGNIYLGSIAVATAKDYAMYGLGAALTKPTWLTIGGASALVTSSGINPYAANVTGLMIYNGKITDKFNDAHICDTYVGAMLAQYGS